MAIEHRFRLLKKHGFIRQDRLFNRGFTAHGGRNLHVAHARSVRKLPLDILKFLPILTVHSLYRLNAWVSSFARAQIRVTLTQEWL